MHFILVTHIHNGSTKKLKAKELLRAERNTSDRSGKMARQTGRDMGTHTNPFFYLESKSPINCDSIAKSRVKSVCVLYKSIPDYSMWST